MKKLILCVIITTTTLGLAAQEPEQKEGRIQRAKRWITQKTKQITPSDMTIARGIKWGSTGAGAVAGAVAGYFAGKKAAKKILPQIGSGYTPKTLHRAGLAGLIAGKIAVMELANRLGTQGAALYLAKRYGTTREFGFASLVANVAPDKEIQQLFQAAKDKDTQFLKEFFAAYYQKLIGDNWYQTVMAAINKFWKSFTFSPEEVIAHKTIDLLYATSLLYWNKKIQEGGFSRNNDAKTFLQQLFGEPQE